MKPRVSEILNGAQQSSHQDLADLGHELLHALDDFELGRGSAGLRGAKSTGTSEALRRLEEVENGSMQSVGGQNSVDLVRKQLAARRR